jgi:phosphate ABC transporter phosphate-binding protein
VKKAIVSPGPCCLVPFYSRGFVDVSAKAATEIVNRAKLIPSQQQAFYTVRALSMLATHRWIVLFLVLGCTLPGAAEPVDSLAKARTIYIAKFNGSQDAERLRSSFVQHLAGGPFRMVSSREQADAIIQGTGQIWLRGYVAINPRTPSTDRQPFFGGYLSISVTNAQGEPPWSWLTTPSRTRWASIVDDLSGHAASKLVDAANAAISAPVSQPSTGALAEISLRGAGATFPDPLYQKWFEDFEQAHPAVHIRYLPVGSQMGTEMLVRDEVDFAGSDIVPELAVGAASASHMRVVASVVGGVVPIYNLKGITAELRFTPEALAGIYLGHIRRWSDPEIKKSNKGVALPDAEIVVVHRSDGSGTTWVWSDYLSHVSSEWSTTVGHGTTLHWPVGNGAEHNEGVAQAVRISPNSIGYVELTYAIQNQLSYGSVRNRSGAFVRADLDSVAAATRRAAPGDHAAFIVDSADKDAYPISAFTWLVLRDENTDPAKQAALTELLRWVLTSGQKECSALGYAPLPRNIADKQLRAIDSVSARR